MRSTVCRRHQPYNAGLMGISQLIVITMYTGITPFAHACKWIIPNVSVTRISTLTRILTACKRSYSDRFSNRSTYNRFRGAVYLCSCFFSPTDKSVGNEAFWLIDILWFCFLENYSFIIFSELTAPFFSIVFAFASLFVDEINSLEKNK